MNRKKITQIGILFILLLLPVIIYLVLATGKQNFMLLPYFGPREAVTNTEGKIDTAYHEIANFELIDQDSQAFAWSDLQKNIVVVNFFFTSCPTTCPMLTSALHSVQEEFPKYDDLHFVSISVDPKTDTPTRMKTYSQRYKADQQRWHFLTGDADKIYDLAKEQFLVTANGGDGMAPAHSNKLVLIDKQNHIRGFFDGTLVKEQKVLKDAIKRLKAWDYIPKKNPDGNDSKARS